MDRYASGIDVAAVVPFLDISGNAVTPTALSYRLLNEDDDELIGATVVALPGGSPTEVTITVPRASNTLVSGVSTALRRVELTMTTANGPIVNVFDYLLVKDQRLIVMENSFQTYGRAIITAEDLLDIDSFTAANQFMKQSALVEAYRRLTRFTYVIRDELLDDSQSYLNTDDIQRITPVVWRALTKTLYESRYPADFRNALNNAQIVEADKILEMDPIDQRRDKGIMSESIGESSMMFRSIKPLDFGLNSRSVEYLRGWLEVRNPVIVRT